MRVCCESFSFAVKFHNAEENEEARSFERKPIDVCFIFFSLSIRKLTSVRDVIRFRWKCAREFSNYIPRSCAHIRVIRSRMFRMGFTVLWKCNRVNCYLYLAKFDRNLLSRAVSCVCDEGTKKYGHDFHLRRSQLWFIAKFSRMFHEWNPQVLNHSALVENKTFSYSNSSLVIRHQSFTLGNKKAIRSFRILLMNFRETLIST